jgi:hypothetical protein
MKLLAGYENFDQKKERFTDLSDFSWQVEGFDLFQRFLPELSQAIFEASEYAL